MRYKQIMTIMIVGILLAWSAPNASGQAAGNLILQVPDWNQPGNYAIGGYPCWCSPTAGANLMGYWEDVMGCVGLTDRQVMPASPGYPGTAGTWEQGLWHDGTVEMGWHMDTGGWQSVPRPFPPGVGMTKLAMIAPGLLGYATGSWTDNDYPPGPPPPPAGTGIVKVAYPVTVVFTHPSGTPLGAMWATYTGEIDSARPVECSFDHWVDDTNQTGTTTIIGFPAQTIEFYPWDWDTDPHSVVGVGYIDPVAGYDGDGTEFFVCQDNWPGPHIPGAGGTGQYVAVPVDYVWQQNDYVTNVPEPFTLTLLAVGGTICLLRRRKR